MITTYSPQRTWATAPIIISILIAGICLCVYLVARRPRQHRSWTHTIAATLATAAVVTATALGAAVGIRDTITSHDAAAARHRLDTWHSDLQRQNSEQRRETLTRAATEALHAPVLALEDPVEEGGTITKILDFANTTRLAEFTSVDILTPARTIKHCALSFGAPGWRGQTIDGSCGGETPAPTTQEPGPTLPLGNADNDAATQKALAPYGWTLDAPHRTVGKQTTVLGLTIKPGWTALDLIDPQGKPQTCHLLPTWTGAKESRLVCDKAGADWLPLLIHGTSSKAPGGSR